MIIELTRKEGESIDGRHVRVLARVPAVDAIHVITRNEYSATIIADSTIKRAGISFQRRKVVRPETMEEVERLCCLFEIVSTNYLQNATTRASIWLSIEREAPISLS